MSKKLIIDKDGDITFDGTKIPKKEITGEFLNSLFTSALNGEVEFDIDETDQISKLFIRIKEETGSESPFFKHFEELRSQLSANSVEKEKIENSPSEKDLPF